MPETVIRPRLKLPAGAGANALAAPAGIDTKPPKVVLTGTESVMTTSMA
jgi:hypothetical protein